MASNRGFRSLTLVLRVVQGDAGLGVGVEDGEIKLLLAGVQVDEQVKELVLTSAMRLSGRSILLITAIRGSPWPGIY
jgi:hypothetical protein